MSPSENPADVLGNIGFMARSPLYETEKPHVFIPAPGSGTLPVGNVELEHKDVLIHDVRKFNARLSVNGFQVAKHESKHLGLKTESDAALYKGETEKFLQSIFPDADRIVTWDLRRRKNIDRSAVVASANGEVQIDAPAQAAHVDTSFNHGAQLLERYLPPELQAEYLKPGSGYRFQVINTWRTLNPVLEDCPLALCDFASMETGDIQETTLTYPDKKGEIYHVYHNPNQRWYWYPMQTPSDLFVFLNYDSESGSDAKYCAHTSFRNPLAGPDTQLRESVETRSIVITRLQE
ncbi:hypothetical protein B0T16DRAFT_395852 [Cercophora newfieldiana]|uniref:Methyltransferase n=1 Tax=Cercophora newfieldiana TaxID=92897 RepID=A0AA39YNN0_9PEZI|nr:hypothetical protein B0T16DRAFT_395852 [Cercophora newfieldiana]